MRLDQSLPLECLRFPGLERVAEVRHAVTTRRGGRSAGPYASANLGLSVGDERAAVLANRGFAGALVCAEAIQPATARQVHGVRAVLVDQPGAAGVPVADGDMLATATAGVPLLVQTADCAGVVVVDPVRVVAAVVHAGWRGAAAAAGREAVATMQRCFGSRADDLLVGIGPSIGVCCYEVGDDVAAAVSAASGGAPAVVSQVHGERPHVDLEAAIWHQLVAAGVPAAGIERAALCTACNPQLFYSHRRDGVPSGRFGVLVAIKG